MAAIKSKIADGGVGSYKKMKAKCQASTSKTFGDPKWFRSRDIADILIFQNGR